MCKGKITVLSGMLFLAIINCNDISVVNNILLMEKDVIINNNRERGKENPTQKKEICCEDKQFFSVDTTKIIALWTFNNKEEVLVTKSKYGNHELKFENPPSMLINTDYGCGVVLNEKNTLFGSAGDSFFSDTISIGALVKIDEYPSPSLSPRPHSMIVSTIDWDSYSKRGYELRISDSDGKVELCLGIDNKWILATSEKRLEKGKWYKVVGQYDGEVASVWVDDSLWGYFKYKGKIDNSQVGVGIGRRIVDQPFYFYGAIDEVIISRERFYFLEIGPDTATCFKVDEYTIAQWTFNENVGPIAFDITGNNHNLLHYNLPTIVEGVRGNARSFNGKNFSVTDFSMDFYPKELTVQAVVKLLEYPYHDMSPRPHMMIYSTVNWYGKYCEGYELRITDADGKVEFIFGDNNGWHSAISEKTLPLNEWHLIAGQYDGKRIAVYVDNELWAETLYEGSIVPCKTTDIGIARRLVDQPIAFKGIIDEIAVSSKLRY